jgi:hypothetical protein
LTESGNRAVKINDSKIVWLFVFSDKGTLNNPFKKCCSNKKFEMDDPRCKTMRGDGDTLKKEEGVKSVEVNTLFAQLRKTAFCQ